MARKKKMIAHKIPSKFYTKIIEVNTPIRFYWAGDDFDGIEFGPINRPLSRYQIRLLYEALDTICRLMGIEPNKLYISEETKHKRKTPMPDYILRAFKDKEEKGEVK